MRQFTNQFAIYFAPYAIFIFILGLLSIIFYKKIVGAAGEFWVKRELKRLPKEYKTLHNIMISANQTTHQIDHIVVSKYGIFVIETKQYNGTLIGNDYDQNWTFRAGRKTYYVHNPVHQNYGHMKALTEVLNLEPNKMIPIVCISSNAKIYIQSNQVVPIYELIRKIKSYKDEILNDPQIYYKKIKEANIKSKKDRKQHITYAKTIKKQKETNKQNKCPKCGADLIKRNGKYGEFWGCTNYPKCKFTKDIQKSNK